MGRVVPATADTTLLAAGRRSTRALAPSGDETTTAGQLPAREPAERSGPARAVPHERGAAGERAGNTPTPPAEDPLGGGLVTCAKTGRDPATPDDLPDPVAALWRPSFPDASRVRHAAKSFERRGHWNGHEGPRPRIVVGPGCIALETRDQAKAERAAERQRRYHEADIAHMVRRVLDDGEIPERTSRRRVTCWSRKSRARMVRRLCELDYTPLVGGTSMRLPAMVTLTYPADWLTVAPDGGAVKRHIDALRKRYERAWGEPFVYVWKLEFQRRGAPHLHLLTRPPHGRSHDGQGQPFRQWLSQAWAEVVGHPDPEERWRHERAGTRVDYAEGLRARDPKRVAVYFTKHGSFAAKGYQHRVPEEWQESGKGPGRFWGYRNLTRTVDAQEITEDDYTWLARLLRRHAHAQGVTREETVTRVDTRTGAVRRRKVRRRVRRFTCGNRSGFVSVNNGPALAAELARALHGAGVSTW